MRESNEADRTLSAHRWRPEIQGLRAVAVLTVVAFHAGVLEGGFVGVDVFFVISGFLISRQLVEPLTTGVGSALLDFYERRVRRIIPAASLVIVSTLVAGWWVLTPLDWRELSGDGVASSTFVMNVRLQGQGIDYLRADAVPSALQHYWSLAIEEQFYLLWPVAVLLVRSFHRRAVTVLVCFVGLLSLAWLLVAGEDATASFFGLPTRAWQLVAGAAALLAARRWPAMTHGSRLVDIVTLGTVGLIVVVVAGPSTRWPGPWTVVLTGAVAGLVMAPGPLARSLLSLRPLQWIGDRSFSWYLLHFPPLIFAEVIAGAPVEPIVAIGISVCTLGAADIMYRGFEQPMRKLKLRRRSVLALGFVAIGLVGGSAAIAQRTTSFDSGAAPTEPAVRLDQSPARSRLLDSEAARDVVPAALRPAIGDARSDRHAVYDDGCHAGFDERSATPCTLVEGTGTSVLVLGDSHAVNWLPALTAQAGAEGWSLSTMTKSGCTPADVETWVAQLERWYAECPVWRESALAQARANSYDVIIVAGASSYLRDHRTAERYPAEAWQDALASTLARLSTFADVYYLEDTARFPDDVPACLSEHLRSASTCAVQADVGVDSNFGRIERGAVIAAEVEFVATRHIVCGDEMCPTFVGDTLWYRDANHFTTAASTSFAEPLGAALAAVGFPG